MILRGVEDVIRKVIRKGDVGWVPSECDLKNLFGGQEGKYGKAINHAISYTRKAAKGTDDLEYFTSELDMDASP